VIAVAPARARTTRRSRTPARRRRRRRDESDRVDLEPADLRVALADGFLYEFLPAGVVHPGERDVRGVNAWFSGSTPSAVVSTSRGLVERGQFRAPGVDPRPDDRDVVEAGEDAESLDGALEGVDVSGLDRLFAGGDHVVE